ncbi:hypothetical protein GINT2_001283 [Glugoides intestinalis]
MLAFAVNILITGAIFNNIHNSFKNNSKEWKKFYKHYFIVMSILIALDNVFSFVLYRIPYYQIFKLLLLGWLSVPLSTGSHFMYSVYIKNIHRLFEGDIDAVIDNIKVYIQQLKAKYYEIIKSSPKGYTLDIQIPARKSVSKDPESSEVEASNSIMADNDEPLVDAKEE